MCLIIHKPAGAALPESLLASAAAFNPHGCGLMAFGTHGRVVIRRRAEGGDAAVCRLYREFAGEECVIHLRYRTRGELGLSNTQPLRVTSRIALVHNGTLAVDSHDTALSDSRQFVDDYLRPMLRRRPELIHTRAFQDLVAQWAGPHNRFVFMDAGTRRTVIVNREAGFDLDGVWLSNTRWFDGSQFDWYRRAQTQAPPLPAVQFSL